MIRHPTLDTFAFQQPAREGPFQVNAIGARTRAHYFPADYWFESTDHLHVNADLLEWVDMLDTVKSAGEQLVFMDLGAGYGRWLVNAALAAQQLGKDYLVVGVEAETTHFDWMIEHLADNRIDPSRYVAIKGVLSDRARDVFFTEGHSTEWYGQSIISAEYQAFGNWPRARVTKHTAIPAPQLLAKYPQIDGIHMDIQGEEERVIPAILPLLQERVRTVHIATHSSEIHDAIGGLFLEAGWVKRRVAPFMGKAVETEFGQINMEDGVQAWRNPMRLWL